MDPRDIELVWQSLDRDHLAAVARRGPTPVFASISGAHLYGFASGDSDVDLRGAYLLDAQAVLGLDTPEETISLSAQEPPPGSEQVLDLDWVAHDLRKFARMMLAHNGYVMEQLYSPLVVIGTPWFEELKHLGQGCLTRPMFRHYHGFAKGRRQRLREPHPTVKHLLYAYRVYLTGIHLLRCGEIDANLPSLNLKFQFPPIDELIHRKRHGQEKMKLLERELSEHERHLDAFEEQLQEAFVQSPLPEESSNRHALDDLLLRARLRTLG